jgi:hypothetical protein
MAVLPQALYTGVTSVTPVPIIAKTWARGVTIAEDGSGAQAGLVIKFPNGNTINLQPSQQPLVLGNVPASGGMQSGPFVGMPASSVGGGGNSATQYCTVESMGATTIVKVVEYN